LVECKDNKLDWGKKIKYENNLIFNVCGNRAVIDGNRAVNPRER
jgi:hypothetical protein